MLLVGSPEVVVGRLLIIMLVSAKAISAQEPGNERAGRAIVGLVTDASTQRPIHYALVQVVGRDGRVFTSPSGRFRLPTLPPGTYILRVQQIGFQVKDVMLRVEESTGAPDLHIQLVPSAYLLPDLVVNAPSGNCTPGVDGADSLVKGLLEEALRNAERVRAIEVEYPIQYRREHLTIRVDSRNFGRIVRRDTSVAVPQERRAYRKGRVLERGRVTDPIALFSVTDLPTEEFQVSHCFHYAGRDTAAGEVLHRIGFVPAPTVRSADWRGVLSIDSVSRLLRKAETHLTNIPSWSRVEASECVVQYAALTATLIHERLLECETRNRRGVRRVLDAQQLLGYRFVSRVPGTN